MTDKKLRVFKIRTYTDEELLKGLDEYKKELANLRTLKVTGGSTASKISKIKVYRKAIAKYLTVINEKNRARIRDDLKKSKYIPTDLRSKRTRAIRRALTPHQKRIVTLRQAKRNNNIGARKFALKA
jgi:large subunit ribosomal protein L35e